MIGAIADDYTGGTDVAVAFRRAGLRTVLYFGVPAEDVALPPHDAVVIALKTRTAPVSEAVADSVAAGAWLRDRGADALYFKYCSTFDSRPEGNIGPVADALAALTGAGTAVVAPSSPEHGRTQYEGHLFVGRLLLSDSPMRHHPLTPMTLSSVADILAPQTPRAVHLVEHRVVRDGHAAISAALDALPADAYAVVDAIDDDDLREIGRAVVDHPLVTGAAGLAGGVALARRARLADAPAASADDVPVDGAAVALAGSCSARTLEQIDDVRRHGRPALHIAASAGATAREIADEALAWLDAQPGGGEGALVYSSLPPRELRRVHEELGADVASAQLEEAMGLIAVGLRERGIRRLVIAGGETSGAVVRALDVAGAVIGAEAAPGVPWIRTVDPDPMTLLLKSGNFGDAGLLTRSVAAGAPAGLVA